ncbi:hypothetical protein BXU06_16515 [Aquaspirillum sp. LM1]|nr:hypothetical protein BXU06_16515 [Aquaspirillum sp. LM1]
MTISLHVRSFWHIVISCSQSCSTIGQKAERFIQTALRKLAYAHSYDSSDHRGQYLLLWLDEYNYRHPHASLGYQPRASALGHHIGSSPSTRTRSSSDHAVALRFMRKLILPFFPIGTGRTKFSTIFFNNDRFCGA